MLFGDRFMKYKREEIEFLILSYFCYCIIDIIRFKLGYQFNSQEMVIYVLLDIMVLY